MESEWLLITCGSGGSVYIQAGYLVGGGTITANGGGASNAAGGGGGRIAVIASTSSFTGVIHAYGGTGSTPGAAGTIFEQGPGANGTLLIDNQNTSTVRLSSVPAGNYTFDSVKVIGLSSATFANFSTVTIAGIKMPSSTATTPRPPRLWAQLTAGPSERVRLLSDRALGRRGQSFENDLHRPNLYDVQLCPRDTVQCHVKSELDDQWIGIGNNVLRPCRRRLRNALSRRRLCGDRSTLIAGTVIARQCRYNRGVR